jgi:DNA repair exonuclease SbcCD ATPase subunit
MADIQEKNPSVELDTDGVNDQVIDVETPKESTSEFQQKEEVDLGYTDVSGKKTAKELLQEVKESEKETKQAEPKFEQRYEEKDSEPSDLEDYSEKVQKRIKRLTFQIKEAERRERAAVDYAKGLKNKYETAQNKYEETDTNYLKEYNARIDAEREKAKNALKQAYETQDTDAILEAQDTLTKLSVEKEKVSMTLQDKESRKKEVESQSAQEVAQPDAPQPRISARAQQWAEDNEWFGSDRVLTSAAMGIHEDLLQEGIDAESDEYYNQINKRMKEYFPHKFAQDTTEVKQATREPVQNVASVSRRSGGRKSVKLTKSQVVIAKKLGVPLEEYAKYVKEGA